MDMKPITLCGVPALAWGKDSDRRILAVHGMMSHKADEPIRLLAEAAEKQDIQAVSIDLPGHGDRKGEMALCTAQHCVPELHAMLESLLEESREVGLFGVSLGACFGLMAAADLQDSIDPSRLHGIGSHPGPLQHYQILKAVLLQVGQNPVRQLRMSGRSPGSRAVRYQIGL